MRPYAVQKYSCALNEFSLSDTGHLALDVAGTVPYIGEAADLTNAIWYANQGQYLNAAFSLISMIPEAGDLIGKGGKVAMWISKLGSKAPVLTGLILKRALQLLKFIKNNKAKIHATIELAGSNKTLRPFIDKINAALESFIEVVLIPLQSSFVKTHVAGSLTGGQQAFIECVQFLSNYHHKTKILESKKTNQRILKEYLKLILESTPSKLNIKQQTLSADSTGFETSHLNKIPLNDDEDEDMLLSPHLQFAEENEETTIPDLGPVPPLAGGAHCYPDPFVRGQFDNVTWER